MLLFVGLTLVLTVATVVWGGRSWLRNSETLVFAVGDGNSLEARFAGKLAAVLKNTNSRLRLKIVPNSDSAKALAAFDRRQADLAVLRTDAKVPPRARALAVLEHDLVLLISPANKKIKSLAELRKKKIAVLADGDTSIGFLRNALEITDGSDGNPRLQPAPLNTTFDKLFASNGYGAVIAIAHASTLMKDKRYEQYARHGGFTVNAIDETKALARRNPGISEELLPTGMLSSSPAIPDDDLDTIGLQWLLVAQSRMPATTAGDLARTIYENKAELALEDGFASRIEPADTDKDAFVIAHQGAAEYINDDTKTFMDRYSDLLYLSVAALSVIGSIFAGIYTKITRIAPEKAGELATAILDIGERIEKANSPEAIEALQDELGYQFVRDEIAMRRAHLRRYSGSEDNVVMVKPAQSA